ncbi:ATP-binding protein, partial [Cryptosporangium japonicum]|uniref:ATP-binding protein n=1 Tax=Cryptosporangium japonicum TaxID=80872 RepID=UPI0031D81B04
SSFANEVTRVAREVGTEGKLGGQAEVRDVSGTWRDLTQSVNILAGNLTTQVRAIADVATAVTRGDLSQAITVETQGELAELKDNINQMINNLKDTTTKNAEQDWLKSNLARIGAQLQGQRDLRQVCQMIMSEITPVVDAQQGAFFLLEATREGLRLRLASSYGYAPRRGESVLSLGEGLVGQAAVERRSIRVEQTPAGYLTIGSGLGEAPPADLVIVPVLFEERVLGVIELASFKNFSDLHMSFLQQLVDTLGVVLNTIIANARTEELLAQSQRLTQELQAQSMELQRTNAELQEKAALLSEQNRNIEIKNREIEMARLGLEEKAEQLALSSQYKTEFMANMSHELRTPLNSLLVLARLLAENTESNLTGRQIEFARTIHDAGWDLLTLINDILDLSKVEAGKMDVHAGRVALDDVCGYVEQTFRAQSELKGLRFAVDRGPGVPDQLFTDEQRLQQILKNLLSNAVKFTDAGTVTLSIHVGPEDMLFASPTLNAADRVVAFAVTDTGIGVAADKLKLIFDPFQQADGSTSRKYGGTGLGLSISREIARVLGGSITVQSDVGRGSTFTLYLPERYPGEAAEPGSGLERLPEDTGQIFSSSTYSGPLRSAPTSIVDAEDIGAAIITQGASSARPTLPELSAPVSYEEKPRPPAPTPRQVESSRPPRGRTGPTVDTSVLAGRTVLIVDDDVRNVFALTSALELHGLTVLYADNGAAGIAMLQAHPEVDLVLMDVMMPDMDGNETTAAIRKMPGFSELPILFLTAKAMPGDRDKSLAAGASDYITKPVDLDRLLRLMAGWVTRDAGAPGPAA